ncbi:ligand-binding sensor domain-containing protein [Reichenbachiella versicolor]|uniref:ligand-binding sensor domain-containing protein n=1 Tax=Reichenbachiella versicolor TaxID=1821036 RepID=UPI000D6DEFA4|nr:sensor histidine kinase [Reichenbachiella versicolor]
MVRNLLRIFIVTFLITIDAFGGSKLSFSPLKTEVPFDNQVRVVHRDSEGYLWIGMRRHGLIRHDSYSVKVFGYHQYDSLSLSNNFITWVGEDYKDRLWVATMHGVNRYDASTETFTRYYHDPTDSSSLPGNFVMTLYEDSQNRLWVICGEGICYYDEANDKFVRVPISIPSGMSNVKFTGFTEDLTGRYWLVSDHYGIWEVMPNKKRSRFIPDEKHDPGFFNHKKLMVDQNNLVWIGSLAQGVIHFDPEKERFYQVPTTLSEGGTNGSIIRNMVELDDQYVLIAVDQGGVNMYDKKTNKVTIPELETEGVFCFSKDDEGILWVGTSRSGVYYYNPKKEQFQIYKRLGNSESDALCSTIVGCFFEDDNDDIWIGSDGGGVTTFNLKTGDFTSLQSMIKSSNVELPEVVRSIDRDQNGLYWIMTWDKGIYVFDKDKGQLQKAKFSEEIEEWLNKGALWSLKFDSRGRLWIATQFGTILTLDTQGELLAVNFDKDMPLRGLSTLFFFHGEEVYTTRFNTIYKFNEETLVFDQVTIAGGDETEILTIKFSVFGKIYVLSYNQGLFIFDEHFEQLKHYTGENGLPSMYLQSMEVDVHDNIWISYVDGILRYNERTGLFATYNEEDGLVHDEFFPQSSIRTNQGELFFGGINGYCRFAPSKIVENPNEPPVYITNVNVVGEDINIRRDKSIIVDSDSIRTLVLDWRSNMLTLDFVGINFTGPGKNQYAYKLNGFDEDWVFTSSRNRKATYTNLPPGDYVFHVKASNNTGLWNEEGAQLKITIQPPFWRTSWFYIGMIIFMIFAIYQYARIRERQLVLTNFKLQTAVDDRTKKIKEQNQLLDDLNHNLEQKIDDKTAELKKTIKRLNVIVSQLDRFIYSTAHELSAPLKSIRGLIGIVANEKYKNPKQYFDYIQKSVLQLENVIDTFVVFSRNSRTELKFEEINLNRIVSDHVESIKYMENASLIDFQIDLDDSLEINSDLIRIQIIINNLINNAVKYSDLSKENSWVSISYEQKNENHFLFISDNGRGISKVVLPRIFEMFYRGSSSSKGTGLGLYIVKEAIDLLQGKIELESEEGQGTTFVVVLPIDRA